MIGGAASGDQAIVFAPFSLLTQQQLLLEEGKPVGLGSRALDILTVLARRAGEVVSKEELIAQVWPGIFVEEGTLRVHIAALRRALGDGQAGRRFIVTTPGRGYSFVAPVSHAAERPPPGQHEAVPALRSGLPALLTKMLGRAGLVELLTAQLRERRLISIVGPGGIGKTTVALAVANAARPLYPDGVQFLDLAPIADPQLVPSALASVLGLPIDTGDSLPRLIAAMREREMLLVLDSCEHVIDVAAALAKEVLRATTRVHILSTSREALRVEGERVQRLSPLEVPRTSTGLTAAQALSFPAVELFVERVLATVDTFDLTDADAPVVADICRRLDGIALAIEFAASRVDAFGVRGVAARLDNRFRLLAAGHRTALPRHQTLAATLDWSYQLLPELERVVLQRLAILAGSFTLTSASAVAAGGAISAPDVIDHVANLVSKSLVSADIASETVFYRLLDTTRAYAREKLVESGEFDRIARQHAEYFCSFFVRAEAELATSAPAEWAATYGRRLDNARAALDWAFAPGGDVALGVALTIAVAPLWSHLLLNEECRSRVEVALASFDLVERGQDRRVMQLFAVLGGTFLFGPQGSKAWTSTLEISEKLRDIDYQLRALRGLWANALNAGDTRSARAFAEKFGRVAAASARTTDALIADRLLAQVSYLRGELKDARAGFERVQAGYGLIGNRLDAFRFQFDQLAIAHCYLSRSLWLQGLVDQAMRMAASTVEEAKAADNTITLNYGLAHAACSIAFQNGDLEAAQRFLTMLLEQAPRDPLRPWESWGRCWKGVLLVRQGDVVTGAQLIASTLDMIPKNYFHMRYTSFLRHLADAWGRAGELAKAAATIDRALDISDRHEERWAYAELLRVKGEILLREGTPSSVAAAEKHFLQSLDAARRQEALSWELRAAISLARLQCGQGRMHEARECLAPVYSRFTEGFHTFDLVAARNLLGTYQ